MESINELKVIIFVVFHDTLNVEYYDKSLLNNYCFINVKPNNINVEEYKKKGFNIINLNNFKNYIYLGKWYTESEVIYNIFKNEYLTKEFDYIGFSQHDIDTSPLNNENLLDIIKNSNHVNFQPFLFESDFKQRILMDIKQPNKLKGKGKNVYSSIIEDYNNFYKSSFSILDLKGVKLNLCSSFVLKKNVFTEMMEFISIIVDSKKLDNFDLNHVNRIQGGFLERYYAVWLAFNKTDNDVLELNHYFEETKNFLDKSKKTFWQKVKFKIFNI